VRGGGLAERGLNKTWKGCEIALFQPAKKTFQTDEKRRSFTDLTPLWGKSLRGGPAEKGGEWRELGPQKKQEEHGKQPSERPIVGGKTSQKGGGITSEAADIDSGEKK